MNLVKIIGGLTLKDARIVILQLHLMKSPLEHFSGMRSDFLIQEGTTSWFNQNLLRTIALILTYLGKYLSRVKTIDIHAFILKVHFDQLFFQVARVRALVYRQLGYMS